MKKMLALLITLMLVISAVSLPVLAEENNATDTTTSATVQPARGGRGGRFQAPGNGQNAQTPGQMPQMPGNQNGQMPGSQNGQMPQMPGSQNGQMPDNNQNGQMPGGQNGQMPGMNGKGGRKGGHSAAGSTVKTEKLEAWLTQLVTDGVITQEVSDAILTYIKDKAAQAQTVTAAPADAAEAPVLPDEAAPAASPEEQLLKEMLENGVITQEQYDQYAGRTAAPEAPEAETSGT